MCGRWVSQSNAALSIGVHTRSSPSPTQSYLTSLRACSRSSSLISFPSSKARISSSASAVPRCAPTRCSIRFSDSVVLRRVYAQKSGAVCRIPHESFFRGSA